MSFKKSVHIISGGTVSHVRTHLALAAVAYGTTGRRLRDLCEAHSEELDVNLHLTKMANSGRGKMETPNDVLELVNTLKEDVNTKIIFMSAAIADYKGYVVDNSSKSTSGKYATRLKSRDGKQLLVIEPEIKILKSIREKRKDIFLVGFKTTSGLSEQEQYIAGLNLLKETSCNLVFSNDVITRKNMIITPEEEKYHVTTNRMEALTNLVDMAYLRSHVSFTRSTVIAGESIPWASEIVPDALREVVNHCIKNGAYKVFRGATVGHFACRIGKTTFLTSKRKTNFNDLPRIGLVKVETSGPDSVMAYGSKPSVGGQSQRIIFNEHSDYDCIVHFHCPIKTGSPVPVASQREYECGSHECGKNTSDHLKQFGNLSAVYLDKHGPNIVFNSKINPQEVIDFIEQNFDLSQKTGGPVKLEFQTTII